MPHIRRWWSEWRQLSTEEELGVEILMCDLHVGSADQLAQGKALKLLATWAGSIVSYLAKPLETKGRECCNVKLSLKHHRRAPHHGFLHLMSIGNTYSVRISHHKRRNTPGRHARRHLW